MEEKTHGQIAYEAYRASSDGKSLVTGEAIPEWHKLGDIKKAWHAAGHAVVQAVAGAGPAIGETLGSR